MNKTSGILKPYLRKFILQTHPDFFHNDVFKKQTNAASLQKLHNILQADVNSTTCQLEFFTKDQKGFKKKLVEIKPKAIAQFEPKDSEWVKANVFFQLCQQANIPILQSNLDAVNDMITKEANKNKPKSQYKSLTKEFAERLYKEQNSSTNVASEWSPKEILEKKTVLIDPSVNIKRVAENLSSWLPHLQPEKWWGRIPVMVLSPDTEQPPQEVTKGILVITSDMKLEDVKKHLDNLLEAQS
ncbi:unnamed protein product [Mucor hiemalis]